MTKEQQTELTEDMEVIGPGQMLREGREALKLSQKNVAEKLNFTLLTVKNIEEDKFDHKISATYTRGYLKNYARLVHISEEDVLDSYELLGVAAIQKAEMQSFSKITKNQTENNLLMWFSYLIVALLITSTVVWWWQEHQQSTTPNNSIKKNLTDFANKTRSKNTHTNKTKHNTKKKLASKIKQAEQALSLKKVDEITKTNQVRGSLITDKSKKTTRNADLTTEQNEIPPVIISALVFTFSGDCWVNIYDATGERIAWGIKKADYVMKISGQAPFTITLGKPELVSINFNGTTIDMSQFNSGNIAKFTLPLKP
ncbi:MAG: helix-turn-helix domain-containing protein [Gammaproteobacteria bacterium]|nr:MAG: helix-turn-helix domain-containing protein [Gammaproteobacteria bacterium]